MRQITATKIDPIVRRVLANPHFWVLVALSTMLLFVYQAWPWRDWQFTQGFWSHFSWLSGLNSFVTNVELKLNMFGVLFFVPIIYGSLTLSWPGGIFAWLLSLLWLLPNVSHWGARWMVGNLALLLLPALLAAILAGERRWRESERRHYAENEQLGRAYVARLLQTQESERRRIAQEIHDQTLQTLLAIANKLDSLASSAVGTATEERHHLGEAEAHGQHGRPPKTECDTQTQHLGQLRTRRRHPMADRQLHRG